MPLIKICGIMTYNDAQMVSTYFPDYIGFIFHKKSSRYIDTKTLCDISDSLRVGFGESGPKMIGVFVNKSLNEIQERAPYLDGFQLHGEETPKEVDEIISAFPNHEIWKALRIKEESDLERITEYSNVNTFVLDAFCEDHHGGSGKKIDTSLLPKIKSYIGEHQKFFIAGGISAQNKDEIVTLSNADGIDLSSSVESSPGNKSEKKVEAFFIS